MNLLVHIKNRLWQSSLKRVSWVSVASLLICASLVGCQQEKTALSGFLSDYSLFKSSPEVEDALYYQDPLKNLADYDRFILEPVQIYLAPGAKGVSVDAVKFEELTDYAWEEANNALSKRYQVVTSPGPGVLRIRVAITDIKLTKPLLNIHPGTKLMGAGLGGASMEAEGIDSMTGLRVFAVVDMREGNRLSIAEGFHEMGHPKQVVKHWVERFVKRLDVAHGYTTE